jgi:hypothetical protein
MHGTAIAALFAGLVLSAASAAEKADPFPCVMPLDGGNGLVDLSALNHRPAGSRGAVTVRDGHFVLSGSDERIRFLGVALTFAAAFPEPDVAQAMARRFARLGINAVRIHYIDGGTAGRFGRHSIWDPASPNVPRLDPAQLARLDRLLAALREQGIYYNLNLKVGRVFGAEDGLPADYLGEPTRQITKSFDLVDPQLISLQRQYASDLLSHVNPYTGLAYARDPAVLAVELNNENSLLMPNRPLDEAAGWPAGPAAAMRAAWNRWLVAHYADPAALRTAWGNATSTPGAPLTLASDRWHLEQNAGGRGSLRAASAGFSATIDSTSGTAWHVQATLPLPTLAAGTELTVVLRARADRRRTITVRHELAQAPWSLCGLDSAVPLTTEWRTIQLPCSVTAAAGDGPTRLVVRLGAAQGSVEIAALQIVRGVLAPALPPDADPAQGNVPLPIAPLGRQRADWLACVLATEQDFVRGMRAHLTRLGVQAPVVCGQASWGPETGVQREQLGDYTDDHQYWDHPSGWRDPATMKAHGKPLVAALGGASPLAELARWRVAGRPFSVSEFNHCAPNPHRAEGLPLLATVAALQDWDMLILHEYGAPPAPLALVWQPFETGSDPALMAYFPSAALAFRGGAVGRLTTSDFHPAEPTPATAWTATAAGEKLLQARLGLTLGATTADSATPAGWTVAGSASATLSAAPHAVYTCAGPGFVAVTGFLGGTTTAGTGYSFTGTSPFGALTVATLDGRPLATSRRILVTALGGSSNTGMRRKADGSGINDWGTAPVLVDGLAGSLDLDVVPNLRVRALDAGGAPLREVPTSTANGHVRFSLDPAIPAVWYLLDERI